MTDEDAETLRAEQQAREHEERERAAQATSPEEAAAAGRRAEKAAYLEEKLGEAAEADAEAGG